MEDSNRIAECYFGITEWEMLNDKNRMCISPAEFDRSEQKEQEMKQEAIKCLHSDFLLLFCRTPGC